MPSATTKPETAPPPVDLTEQTQGQTRSAAIGGSGILWAPNGSCGNPMGYPGYEAGYFRNYATYRWMRQFSRIRQAEGFVVNPVIGNTWDYKPRDEKVADDRVELVRKNFDPLRRRLVEDACGGFSYGHAPFEPIWDTIDGEWCLCEMKPLLQDWTSVLVDDNGRFTGLSQGRLKNPALKAATAGGADVQALPAPYKAWLFTYNRECGNLYGRSWLENIRETAWKDWLDCAQQLQKLSAKIAGVQAIAMAPIAKKDEVIAGVKALANGAPGVYLETNPYSIPQDKALGNPDWMKIVIELTKNPPSSITPLDFGNTTAAILGLLARQQHDEELMFAGAQLSSRVGMEGKHGTKAEAGVHTETGIAVSELLDDDIAQQLQVMVDALLVLNFGPDAAGEVYIDPAPLVDTKKESAKAWLTAITAPGPVALALSNITDRVQLAKDLEAPVIEGATNEPIEALPPPNDNVPVKQGTNGNGKKPNSPIVDRAARRLGYGPNGN